MPVVGVLNPVSARVPPLMAAFGQGLAEEGYVEGKNLAIKDRFTNFRPELMREAAGDLVRLKVNVIYATEFSGYVQEMRQLRRENPTRCQAR